MGLAHEGGAKQLPGDGSKADDFAPAPMRRHTRYRGRRRPGSLKMVRAKKTHEHELPTAPQPATLDQAAELVPPQDREALGGAAGDSCKDQVCDSDTQVAELTSGDEARVAGLDAPERCATHPGSRNELWCESCETAICGHCARNVAHQAHAVVKLSAAYDDTFEAIEAMQVEMVRSLTDTRQRSALLDAVLLDLATAYGQAQEALDRQVRRDADALEASFTQTQGKLQARLDECREWRSGLEETLKTVQMMVEEFPPAQMVLRRERILGLLEAVERARPTDWWAPPPPADDLADLVQPGWRYTTLYVPMVLELGRKRGHVRVVSDPFPAHGMVWRVEARRSRGPLGDPCLLIAVSCIEGCETSALAIGVHIAAADTTRNSSSSMASTRGGSALELLRRPTEHDQQQHFRQEDHANAWSKNALREFSVCSLPELEDSNVLDGDGGVTVRFGVRPESFKELARVQHERICALEEQVGELRRQKQLNSVDAYGDPDGALSVRQNRRRRDTSDVRGWATSPRINHHGGIGAVRMRQVAEPSSSVGSPRMSAALLSGFTFTSTRDSHVADSPSLLLSPLVVGPDHLRQSSQPNIQLRRSPPEALANSVRRRANSNQARGSGQIPVTSSPLRIGSMLPASPASMCPKSNTAGPNATVSMAPERHARAQTESPARPHRRLPVPFPLGAPRATSLQFSMFGIAACSNVSQVSMAYSQPEFSRQQATSEDGKPAGMLRRLSGWMKTTEGRVTQQAKRMRQQLVVGGNAGHQHSGDKDDDICDWTFLDGTLSPGSPKADSSAAPTSLAMRLVGTAENESPVVAAIARRSRGSQRAIGGPPSIPLPPVPEAARRNDQASAEAGTSEDDFEFDGAADIEREQAEVDARAAAAAAAAACVQPMGEHQLNSRREQASSDKDEGLRARYDSILERVDALQLIANTVENSRDGFSEGTLRRISSELGILRDGRMRRFAEARALALGVAPLGPAQRKSSAQSRLASPLADRLGAPRPQTAEDGRPRSALAGGIRRAIEGADIDMLGATPCHESPIILRKKSATIAMDCRPQLLGEQQPSPTMSTRSGSLDGLAGGLLAETLDRLDIGGAGRRRRDSRDERDEAAHGERMSPIWLASPHSQQRHRSQASSASSGSLASDCGRSPARETSVPLLYGRHSGVSIDAVRSPPPAVQPPGGESPDAVAGDGMHLAAQQLTPQAIRRGGILKAGRSKRVTPARLHVSLLEQHPESAASSGDFGGMSIHTPQGRGRFTEYEAGPQLTTGPSGRTSPVAGTPERSTMQPALVGRAGTSVVARRHPDPPTTPLSSKVAGTPGRQVRSARTLRKCVRFPEEQRLLETIRLIDPLIAQSIESRAAKGASDDIDPGTAAVRMVSPPTFELDGDGRGDGGDESGDEHSLHAPRYPPALAGLGPTDTSVDGDDLSVELSSAQITPDAYCSATSLPFSDAAASPLMLLDDDECASCPQSPTTWHQRLQAARGGKAGPEFAIATEMRGRGADGSASDAFASGEDSDGGQSGRYEDAISETGHLRCAGARNDNESQARGVVGMWPPRTNARGQAVGPNVGSAQSSPASAVQVLGAANCSPSPSPPAIDGCIPAVAAELARAHISRTE